MLEKGAISKEFCGVGMEREGSIWVWFWIFIQMWSGRCVCTCELACTRPFPSSVLCEDLEAATPVAVSTPRAQILLLTTVLQKGNPSALRSKAVSSPCRENTRWGATSKAVSERGTSWQHGSHPEGVLRAGPIWAKTKHRDRPGFSSAE